MSDADWHAWRRGADLVDGCAITASNIARAASGMYGGAYGVVAEHLGLIEREGTNEAMERGHRLEPTVTTAAEVLTGLHIVGEQTWCQHPEHPEWRATVDGFASPSPAPTIDDCTHVVEVKTRNAVRHPPWDYWNAQVQWQMLVTGIPDALLAEAVYDDAEERVRALRLHLIPADELAQIDLMDLAEFLLGHMRAGTTPDPDAGALDLVKAATHVADPDAAVVDLTDHAADVARLAELRQSIKADEAAAKEIEARIRNLVGEATRGVCDGWELTISKPRRTLTPDGERALLEAHPGLGKTVLDRDLAKAQAKAEYEAALSPVGARSLTIKEKTT